MTVDEQRVAVIVAHIVGQAHRHTLKMMKSGKFDLCLQFFKLLQLVHDLSEVMNSAIYAEKFNVWFVVSSVFEVSVCTVYDRCPYNKA